MNIRLEDYNVEQFEKGLTEFGITLKKRQICHFLTYYERLIEWNSFMNLTAITEYEDVMKKHFLDSLSIIKACPEIADPTRKIRLIDVGTGAGFPGLPIKIAFPHVEVTLLDSLNKRINFLKAVIEELELDDIEALHGRAEEFAKASLLRESYDICVSRAVANLSTLSEYCLPYVKVGGKFVSYKSEKIAEEREKAARAIELLGGEEIDQEEFILPGTDIYRNLFVIEKVKNTPKKFPRKAGLASKEPIE